MQKFWKHYRGCFYPSLAVGFCLSVFALLAEIIDIENANIPRPDLSRISEYPESMSFGEIIQFTDTGMKWLTLTYFYWLVSLFTIIFCWVQFNKALKHESTQQQRIAKKLFIIVQGATALILLYLVVVEDTHLMSFGFLLENLEIIGQGMITLTTCSTALAYLALIAIFSSISLLLLPNGHSGEARFQIRAITRVMYAAAAFLLIWVTQATEMYRFSTLLLIEKERIDALNFAPTISLVVGIFASILLAAAYLSAYYWLQLRFRQSLPKHEIGEEVHEASPKQFMLTHWPKIIAVLMPMFPGAISAVLSSVGQSI